MAGALLTDYHRAFVEPRYHFSFVLLPWVEPWPPFGVYLHFAFNSVMALLVAVGYRYHTTAPLLCAGLTSLFVMERGVYINHIYLYCLFALLLAIVPANRAASLDAAAGRVATTAVAPAWTIYLLRFQIAIVYVFAGLAKIEPDWLAALPMEIWLAERAHYPIIGAWLTFPATAHVVAWGGLFLDLLVVPALLVRRTRVFAFIAATAFHVANAVMFGIGTFPWFSIVATTLFFTPESFRRIPSFDRLLPVRGTPEARSYPVSAARTALLALYVTVQCLVPLRHFLYPGPAAWTEEGRTFAWQMMLRDKRGSVAFEVRDPRSAERWVEDPAEYLTEWQRRTLVGNPDLILQFAHRLAADYAERGHPDVEVRARTEVSLNGRPARPIVDPRIDLAREPRRLTHYPWIEPLVDAGRAE